MANVEQKQKRYDKKSIIAGLLSYLLFVFVMIFFATTDVLTGFDKEYAYVVLFGVYFVVFLGAGYYFTYNSTTKWIRVVGTIVIAAGLCIPGVFLTFLLSFARLGS